MDLSMIEQMITFLTLPFQSFLTIEIFLIFIIVYIFLLYNEKRQNKKVKIILIALLIFFFSLLVFYFSDDIINVLNEMGDAYVQRNRSKGNQNKSYKGDSGRMDAGRGGQ